MGSTQTANSTFTWRAIILGTAMSLLMAVSAPFSRYVLYSSPTVFTPFSWGVVLVWVLVLVADVSVLRRFASWRPFTPGELALMFMIASVGSSQTTTAVSGPIVTIVGGVRYFAAPENRWLETFGDMLPLWVIPTDVNYAVTLLFDGVPKGDPFPFGDWLVPLFWQGSFTLAFFLVQFALVALLRKYWVEHERLTFPIMQVPLELIRQPKAGEFRPPWTRPRLFWIGFGIPSAFTMLTMLSWFWPMVPQLPTALGSISFGPEFPVMNMNLFWPVIGVSFFANKDVLFSLLFFTLLGTLSTGWLTRLGIDVGAGGQPMQWLNTGALTVMVLWFLWQARHHLAAAARRALGRDDGDDDTNEMVSYRTAYLILIGSVVYMLFWALSTGMSVVIALLLIAVPTIIFLGIARLAFEAGVMHVNAPLQSANIIVESIGSANISHTSLVALSHHVWRFLNVKSLFLITFGHAGALMQSAPVPRRRTTVVIGSVTVVTTIAAIWYTMHLGFSYGGFNFQDWVFATGGERPYTLLMQWITDPQPADTRRLSFLGIGGGLMALLTMARYLFTWWPLHPIGLAICFSFHIQNSFLSFLIAWITKSLALRLGGIALYRRTVPLFIGIIVGAFAATALCFFVDLIWFPQAGHVVEFK